METPKWPLERLEAVSEMGTPIDYIHPDDVLALERFTEDLVRALLARDNLSLEMSRENMHACNQAWIAVMDNPLFAAVREAVEKEKDNG